MYQALSNEFRKKAYSNIITRITTRIYFILAIIIFPITKYSIFLYSFYLFLILFALYVIVGACITKTSLCDNLATVKQKIAKQEYEIIKDIIKKNNMYKKDIILDLINHYRNLIVPITLNNNNFFVLLPLVISLIDSMFSPDKSINYFNIVLYVFVIIVFGCIYFAIYFLRKIVIAYNGKDNVNERIEELLNILLVEISNQNKLKIFACNLFNFFNKKTDK